MVFPGGPEVKESACNAADAGDTFNPWVGRRKWQPIPVFLPGKFHGQRSLAGCNPCKVVCRGEPGDDWVRRLVETQLIRVISFWMKRIASTIKTQIFTRTHCVGFAMCFCLSQQAYLERPPVVWGLGEDWKWNQMDNTSTSSDSAIMVYGQHHLKG